MKRWFTTLVMLAVLALCQAVDGWAQGVPVFNGGESAHGGAPNVPFIFMFDSIDDDTLFFGSYGFTPEDEEDREYMYWSNWDGAPHQGTGSLLLDWSIWSDQSWGGSNALQHYLPDTTEQFYDFSDFTHLHLWYNNLVPSAAAEGMTLRIKLQDASLGLGTAPSSETEDWYSQRSDVFTDAVPGWKEFVVPLENVGVGGSTVDATGFRRPGCDISGSAETQSGCWSGLLGNQELDLDKISGFQLEWSAPQFGADDDSTTSGNIVLDAFYVTGVRYDLLESFDAGADGGWVNGSGSRSVAVVADTVEGTGALELTYNVVGDVSWGGSVDTQVRPATGSTFANLDDNTAISMFYKVLEPMQGDARVVFKLFDGSLPSGMHWELSSNDVLADDSGQWRRWLMPLDDFAIPSWQNPPVGTVMNRTNITEMQIQIIVNNGQNGQGKILFDRIASYGARETDFVAPEAVQGLTVDASDASNLVSWTDVPNEEDETYDVYFSTRPITDVTAPGVMVAASDVAENQEVVIHELFSPVTDQGTRYYYAITATDRAGNTSEVTATTAATENEATGLATISLAPPAGFVADGNLGEWSGLTPIHVAPGAPLGHVPPNFVVTSPEDASADVYLAMDDEALYVAFEVTDDQYFTVPDPLPTDGGAWNYDGAELYIGLYDWRSHAHGSLLGGEEPDYQINFYSNDVVTRSGLDGNVATSGDENYMFLRTATGYVIEARLPYETFAKTDAPAFRPLNGMRIPLDFKIMDNDTGGGSRSGMLTYSNLDDDNSHLSPEYWFYTWVGDRFEVSTATEGPSGLPTAYTLAQNYPNPFNPQTVIAYELPLASKVTMKVFNVLGQEVRTLVDAAQNAGRYEVRFDASSLPSGVYFYQIQAGTFRQVKKMLLVR